MASRLGECGNCKKERMLCGRGLCSYCWHKPEVRVKFPSRQGSRRKDDGRGEREPTMAEVEAVIAEQMRPENLPAWWPRKGEVDHDGGQEKAAKT